MSIGERATLRVTSLRSQLPDGVLAIGSEPPRLTWTLESAVPGAVQAAYEIVASRTPDFSDQIAGTGEVASSAQVGVPAPGGPLRSREVRHYRVRVRSAARMSDWGPQLRVEAGLLRAEDWQATAITLPDDPGRRGQSPSPYVRREFPIDGQVTHARLYVTSLGVHEIRINGRRVGEDLLAPGWTSYHHRLLADTHDVASLLVPGTNVIAAVLGDGWYRGRLGWEPGKDRGRYGDDLGLILQLEVEAAGRRIVVASDMSWKAATAEIRMADLYDGATVDLRQGRPGWDRPGHDDPAWQPVSVVAFDRGLIEPRMAEPVQVVETRPMHEVGTANGTVFDCGQNLAGFVRLKVHGKPGDKVAVRHAEVLEADGSLHTRSLRSAKATDEYVLSGEDEVILEPPFTFHGFRFAEVVTDATILQVDAVAISSHLRQRSTFSCSDPRLEQLHSNVAWSQRGNFVSIPTDCPQRDERLGWTGDAQAFAATACTLTDAAAFWGSWLRDLDLDQDDEFGVPSVVPDVVLGGPARYGRAGWADAATIVPWAVYESFGDAEVLRRQFGSMRRWVDSLVARQGPGGLLVPSLQLGDWLDPDAPSDRPWEAKAPPEFLANAFFAHSARLLADAAAVLAEAASERRYREVAERVAAATWECWSDEAHTTLTSCAVALQFGIAPPDRRAEVADALARLVDAAGGRVATGFLGTPLVLPALASTGRFDAAYRMLLCDQAPSWLYQLAHGATTVWERWDAIRPDGSIHPGTLAPFPGAGSDEEGQMLSFNHYAYGAVVDWMYRHVAGIAPDPSGPGYAVVRFAPRPADAISWARASVDSPYGRVAIEWRLAGGRFEADLELPVGTRGRLVPPSGPASEVSLDGSLMSPEADIDLEPGRHHLVVTDAAVITTGRPS